MAGERPIQLKIEVELEVEVVDAELLQQAAIARIDAMEIVDDGGAEKIREDERARVRDGGPVAALIALAEPYDLLPEGAGVEIVRSAHGPLSSDVVEAQPDFDQLFDVCRCGREECPNCEAFQLTPRTAAVLWRVAGVLGDNAYDDVVNNGDEAVTDTGDWSLFHRYPRLTFAQDAVWRRQAARSFDDLSDDLEAGAWPRPTCPGEEMALHRIVNEAEAAVSDAWWGDLEAISSEGTHDDDYDWDMIREAFFQDLDILSLFDESLDGIDDPDSELNSNTGMGDYRPRSWFASFGNMTPRDGRRPFRR